MRSRLTNEKKRMTIFTVEYFLGVFAVYIFAENIDNTITQVKYFSAILVTITPT